LTARKNTDTVLTWRIIEANLSVYRYGKDGHEASSAQRRTNNTVSAARYKALTMKVNFKLTNLGIGIDIGFDDGKEKKPLVPRNGVDQKSPKGFYVYAHCDKQGHVFYIGKGTDKRAWSKHRHPLWVRYVEKHLDGKFHVRILADNLTSEVAEELEAEFIAQYGDSLVNWFNMARSLDLETLDKYHKLRDANRTLIQKARTVEKEDIDSAVRLYIKAIEDTRAYAFMCFEEKGLVGQLLEEEAAELGKKGELEALDRLTLCLIRLGKSREAAEWASSYFSLYRRDLMLKASERIQKRIEKALVRQR